MGIEFTLNTRVSMGTHSSATSFPSIHSARASGPPGKVPQEA